MTNERKSLLLALSAVLLWSTVATAFKLTLEQFSPLQMLTVACLVSVITLFAICLLQKKASKIIPTLLANPWYYLVLGSINPLAYYLILFKAYELLPASQAQPINYSWAITLTLMAAIFLGQKITKRDWLACLLGYSGVVIIATKGNLLAMEFSSPLGVGLAILSTLLWAGYWILNTKNRADPIVGLLLSFAIAFPITVALCWYYDLLNINHWQIDATGWLAVTYVGLFEMGVTFVLWLSALKLSTNTAKISNLIFISPFISLLLLSYIIGEQIHPSTMLGLSLIVAGLFIQQKKRKA